jgi:hypothetical protein
MRETSFSRFDCSPATNNAAASLDSLPRFKSLRHDVPKRVPVFTTWIVEALKTDLDPHSEPPHAI